MATRGGDSTLESETTAKVRREGQQCPAHRSASETNSQRGELMLSHFSRCSYALHPAPLSLAIGNRQQIEIAQGRRHFLPPDRPSDGD